MIDIAQVAILDKVTTNLKNATYCCSKDQNTNLFRLSVKFK